MKIIKPETEKSVLHHVILEQEEGNKIIAFYDHAKTLIDPIIKDEKFPLDVRKSLYKFITEFQSIIEQDNFRPNTYCPLWDFEVVILENILKHYY